VLVLFIDDPKSCSPYKTHSLVKEKTAFVNTNIIKVFHTIVEFMVCQDFKKRGHSTNSKLKVRLCVSQKMMIQCVNVGKTS